MLQGPFIIAKISFARIRKAFCLRGYSNFKNSGGIQLR